MANTPNAECPSCKTSLGPRPKQFLRPDPILGAVIRKLLPNYFNEECDKPLLPDKIETVPKKPKAELIVIPFKVEIDKKLKYLLMKLAWQTKYG